MFTLRMASECTSTVFIDDFSYVLYTVEKGLHVFAQPMYNLQSHVNKWCFILLRLFFLGYLPNTSNQTFQITVSVDRTFLSAASQTGFQVVIKKLAEGNSYEKVNFNQSRKKTIEEIVE